MSLMSRLQQQPYWIALALAVILTIWVLSGSSAQPTLEPKTEQVHSLTKVRTQSMQAEQVERVVELYGRTEPDRIATISSELNSKVTKVLVDKGQRVRQGQLILTLSENDLRHQLLSAQALVKQREIELNAAQSLEQSGYQSQSSLASALANLESAKATVASLKRDLENTQIVAPFDGILNERQVEVGDYLSVGDAIAQLVDMDPLVIRADVTESHIQSLTVGGAATGRLATGQHVEGVIRYISSVSTAGTNTFPIEVAVDNTDDKFVAGISTELSIAYDSTWAIKLSSGLMSLDEQGNLGIKTVEDDVVHFVPIDLVKSDKFGVWLSGLGQQAEVITLGQGFVRDGDKVEVVVK